MKAKPSRMSLIRQWIITALVVVPTCLALVFLLVLSGPHVVVFINEDIGIPVELAFSSGGLPLDHRLAREDEYSGPPPLRSPTSFREIRIVFLAHSGQVGEPTGKRLSVLRYKFCTGRTVFI